MRALVVDLETTGLNPRKDKILDVWYHAVFDTTDSVCWKTDVKGLGEVVRVNNPPVIIFQNMKFDLHMLYTHGLDLRDRSIRDTMLMHHLIDEEAPHDLDSMVQSNFKDNYKHLFWSKYDKYEEAPQVERDEYAKKDVLYTGRLYHLFLDQLTHAGVPDSLVEHAHRLALSLLDTEIHGVRVDLDYIHSLGDTLQGKIAAVKPQMRASASIPIASIEVGMWEKEIAKYKTPKRKQLVSCPEFNFDSATQLKDLLYNHLNLPVQYNNKTKAVSTDDASLAALGDAHPLLPMLRAYREHQKVYGTYIEGILGKTEGDRVYPSFNVNGTKTGRISHSEPNLGNMPAEGGVRGMFVPDPGHKIVSADYAQLEITLAAHFSRDENLLKIVHDGASMHDITAAALKIERALAKTLNFAIQYGATEFRIAHVIKCSIDEAKGLLNQYWRTYSGLKRLIDECTKKVDDGVPIISPFGRARHFPRSFGNKWERARAHRQAFNALIQGTGGDLTSRAFYGIFERMKTGVGRTWFTVHDEILTEVPEGGVDWVRDVMLTNMVDAGKEISLTVPLTVQVSPGMDRWED